MFTIKKLRYLIAACTATIVALIALLGALQIASVLLQGGLYWILCMVIGAFFGVAVHYGYMRIRTALSAYLLFALAKTVLGAIFLAPKSDVPYAPLAITDIGIGTLGFIAGFTMFFLADRK